ncbi:unnamed protein product [Amoebophrya sp. A120]|nr:unnamed protein product [Amoebophrya sp. A120]|eukprot:GSA120T00018674001.1
MYEVRHHENACPLAQQVSSKRWPATALADTDLNVTGEVRRAVEACTGELDKKGKPTEIAKLIDFTGQANILREIETPEQPVQDLQAEYCDIVKEVCNWPDFDITPDLPNLPELYADSTLPRPRSWRIREIRCACIPCLRSNSLRPKKLGSLRLAFIHMRANQQQATEEKFAAAFAPPPPPQQPQRPLPGRKHNDPPPRVKQALELRGASKALPPGVTYNKKTQKLLVTVRVKMDDDGETYPLSKVVDPELSATAEEALEAAQQARADVLANYRERVDVIRAQRAQRAEAPTPPFGGLAQ